MVDDSDSDVSLEDDAAENSNADTAENSNGDWTVRLGDLVGTEDSREIQPGSPKLEHAAFVFLGVLATLFAIFRTLFG